MPAVGRTNGENQIFPKKKKILPTASGDSSPRPKMLMNSRASHIMLTILAIISCKWHRKWFTAPPIVNNESSAQIFATSRCPWTKAVKSNVLETTIHASNHRLAGRDNIVGPDAFEMVEIDPDFIEILIVCSKGKTPTKLRDATTKMPLFVPESGIFKTKPNYPSRIVTPKNSKANFGKIRSKNSGPNPPQMEQISPFCRTTQPPDRPRSRSLSLTKPFLPRTAPRILGAKWHKDYSTVRRSLMLQSQNMVQKCENKFANAASQNMAP